MKIKVEKQKNNKGLEFNTIDIGELIKVSPEMFERNEDNYNGGYKKDNTNVPYYGQCVQCAKGIKNAHSSFSIIAILNPNIIVEIKQEDIARDHNGFMESFELGPECGRRIKKAIKDLGLNWKDYLFVHKKERI
jgi:hypothetical protein